MLSTSVLSRNLDFIIIHIVFLSSFCNRTNFAKILILLNKPHRNVHTDGLDGSFCKVSKYLSKAVLTGWTNGLSFDANISSPVIGM